MTYRQLERLYCQTDWSNAESVRRYNEAAREYRAEQEKAQKDSVDE